MTDVLLIQANEFFSGPPMQRNSLPTNLLYLATNLNLAGFSVRIYPLALADLPELPQDFIELSHYYVRLVQTLKNFAPVRYIGISCFGSSFYLSTVTIAWAVREALPDATIIVGGFGPTVTPGDFIYEQSPFDFIFLGEADIEIVTLIKKLENASNEDRLPGKYGKAHIIHCPEIPDISNLPLLNWDLINDIHFINSKMLFIPYYSSRGCPFKCKYCCDLSNMSELGYHKKWRPQSVENVIKEINSLEKFLGNQPRTFYFNDAIFGLDKSWKQELLDILIKESNEKKNRSFWIEERVDTITEEDIKKYSQLNMGLSLGMESGSPKMLQLMGKTNKPLAYLDKMLNVRDMLEEYGCYYTINIMMGYPGETETELSETLTFASGLFEKTRYGFPNLGKYCFFPGSYVFKNYLKPEFEGLNVWIPDWYKRACNANLMSTLIDPSPGFTFTKIYEIGCKWAKDLFSNISKRFAPIPKKNTIYYQFKYQMLDRFTVGWEMRKQLFTILAAELKDNMPDVIPVDNNFHKIISDPDRYSSKHFTFMKDVQKRIMK
ncbi:MAG: B12-binding domain-containing radical SAM protein [Spirochaetales bacterium]|nr:B12-binding domain-containing radical SAM protein [Spirochaetales bacterium]